MTVSVLDVDSLSAAELRGLDFADQVNVLNDLFGEIQRLGNAKCMALDVLADARIAAVRDPNPEKKARVIDAKRDLDIVAVAISARKEQIRVLQTLVRSVPT